MRCPATSSMPLHLWHSLSRSILVEAHRRWPFFSGNVVGGDGCGPTCRLEPLPDNVRRVVSTATTTGMIPRAQIDAATVPSKAQRLVVLHELV